jgi:hypothetical protein
MGPMTAASTKGQDEESIRLMISEAAAHAAEHRGAADGTVHLDE